MFLTKLVRLRKLAAAALMRRPAVLSHQPAAQRAGAGRVRAAAAAAPAAATSGAPCRAHGGQGDGRQPLRPEALWTQGDFVARGTLIIMVIMSMGSWYIIFTKLFEQRKLMKSAKAGGRDLLERRLGQGRRRQRSKKAAPSASSPRAASRPASTTKARWSSRSTSTPGSA